MRISLLCLVTLLAAFAGPASIASAHAFPERETPGAGQTLDAAPSEVSITYDAPIEKLFADLQVVGPDGKNAAIGTPHISSDGRTLSVRLGAIKPGNYKVKWSVICVDTHHTQGSYTFSIAGRST